jgi:hypothetical protein
VRKKWFLENCNFGRINLETDAILYVEDIQVFSINAEFIFTNGMKINIS